MRLLVSFLMVFAVSATGAQVPDTESAATAVGTAVASPTATPQACGSDITGTKPKIYIANFLVTYGQKSMGRLVADNIAFKFETDDRFEIIPRKIINKEMSPYFKKSLQAEEYLNLAVTLAGEKQADCVIFGKISKSGTKISFLVRMASVATGENRKKIDQDVDRKEASAFFENTSNELVAYFSAAQPPPAPVPEPPPKKETKFTLAGWGGYNFIKLDSTTQKVFDNLEKLPGSSGKTGGIGGGADAWIRLGGPIEAGAGLAFLPLYQYKYQEVNGTVTTTLDFNIRYMPAMVQLRFISDIGFYIGAGAGFFVGVSSVSVTFHDSLTGISVAGQAAAAGSALGANAMIGWQIPLGDSAAFDIGAKGWYIADSLAGLSVTPYAGFALKF